MVQAQNSGSSGQQQMQLNTSSNPNFANLIGQADAQQRQDVGFNQQLSHREYQQQQ